MTGTTTGAQPARTDRPVAQRTRIGRPFQKGNPGRPKGLQTKATRVGIEITRAMSGRAAERLAQLVDSRSHRIAFEASRLVLAYAWGMPKATLEVSGAFGDLARELSLALQAARERRAAQEAFSNSHPLSASALAIPAGADAPVLPGLEAAKPEAES